MLSLQQMYDLIQELDEADEQNCVPSTIYIEAIYLSNMKMNLGEYQTMFAQLSIKADVK